jgi:3-methyladenine DNA glycosylase AlkD
MFLSPTQLADRIEAALREAGTAERAVQEAKYLKSDLEHLGAGATALKATVRALVPKPPPHDELIALVEALWGGVFERRAAAVLLHERGKRELVAADLPLIERLLREAKTWALVDQLAVHVVGPLVVRFPALTRTLDRWAKDPDFWIRRSAMLALLLELRQGRGDFDRFARYADAMLDETEFFIRKAIGWILRETAKKQPAAVTAWLLPRAARAAGLTIREAIKYLPARDAAAITAARKH